MTSQQKPEFSETGIARTMTALGIFFSLPLAGFLWCLLVAALVLATHHQIDLRLQPLAFLYHSNGYFIGTLFLAAPLAFFLAAAYGGVEQGKFSDRWAKIVWIVSILFHGIPFFLAAYVVVWPWMAYAAGGPLPWSRDFVVLLIMAVAMLVLFAAGSLSALALVLRMQAAQTQEDPA